MIIDVGLVVFRQRSSRLRSPALVGASVFPFIVIAVEVQPCHCRRLCSAVLESAVRTAFETLGFVLAFGWRRLDWWLRKARSRSSGGKGAGVAEAGRAGEADAG